MTRIETQVPDTTVKLTTKNLMHIHQLLALTIGAKSVEVEVIYTIIRHIG